MSLVQACFEREGMVWGDNIYFKMTISTMIMEGETEVESCMLQRIYVTST